MTAADRAGCEEWDRWAGMTQKKRKPRNVNIGGLIGCGIVNASQRPIENMPKGIQELQNLDEHIALSGERLIKRNMQLIWLCTEPFAKGVLFGLTNVHLAANLAGQRLITRTTGRD